MLADNFPYPQWTILRGVPMHANIDVEPTNRCNAKCHFCPRDMTPHQGLMSAETFARVLERACELRDVTGTECQMNFCGLGEPLLNPRTPEFLRRARDAGFDTGMSSNAAILDERRGRALLDAGLGQININVGEEGASYEDVYKLPFEKTRDNVVRFAEMAGSACKVNIVIVDHRRDRDHVRSMVSYWRQFGLQNFVFFDVMNRGGALFVDDMQYESFPQRAMARELLESKGGAICGLPFVSMFVGYDGNYYLCCSDWIKEAPVGSVFDETFLSIIEPKLAHVTCREPVCKKCNWDPVNQLTDMLRAVDAGEASEAERDELVEKLVSTSRTVMAELEPFRVQDAAGQPRASRRVIPVTAV